MTIDIVLNKDTTPSLTEPFCTKEDEEITLNFRSEYELNYAKITLVNGDVKGTYDFEKQFVVPDKFMFEGRLHISIELLYDNRVVKKWAIMPVKIEKTSSGLKIYDYLSSIEERLKAVEKYQEII